MQITDMEKEFVKFWNKKFRQISWFGSSKWYILFLADVFENFRKICLKIYQIDPAKFLSAPELAWQAALIKTDVKLELLTDTDTLLMVEKGVRGGICNTIHQYEKANNKYRKDYDKHKEWSFLQYWDVKNLYGWAMSPKFPVNKFE